MRQGLSLSTRLTIAIVALVVVTAGAVGYLSYRNIAAIAVPRTLVRLDAHVRIMAGDLTHVLNSARADIKGFRRGIGLSELVTLSRDDSPAAKAKRDEWRTRIVRRFASELDAKPNYDQFRLIEIADGGREILRVDRLGPDGAVRIVPDQALERAPDQKYIRQAIAATPGSVVVSEIDLNRENGVVELPMVPIVRVSTAITTPNGEPFGVIMINVNLRSVFTRLDDVANPETAVYVVNARGDYLAHPDERKEFGFAFGTPFQIQDDFPDLAEAVATGELQPQLIADKSGKRFGMALTSITIPGGPRLSIIEAIPEERIVAAAVTALRDSSLLGGLLAVLGAIVVAFLLARTFTRPLTQMTAAVSAFSQDAPLSVPVTASGEIGVLARAFAHMAHEARDKSAAIRRDRDIFESIMATMAEAVMLFDNEGTVIYENNAANTILKSPAEKDVKSWSQAFELFHPDGVTPLPHDRWPSARSVRGEHLDEFELLSRPHGADKLKHLICSARPIRDAAGNQTGAVVVFRDVTEAKETERQLHQSQKLDAIGQLTGGVAHDFNNMLTVIIGTSEILTEGLADRPQLLAIARMIEEAADRGAELTRHLLAFARKQPLQPREVDVNTMVLNAAQLLRPTLGEHIEIESMLEDATEPAHIDPSQLSAALLNLAVNARDAMPDGGKLLLETGNVVLDESYTLGNPGIEPGPYVMIAVSDTGIGIPAGLLDKVFEPFFTTKPIGKGTGLGLSMVYGFVRQSNGHIKIYSEEGHGTTIKLYLPRATAESEPQFGAPQVEGGSETILVVEDDALVRDFVTAQLHSLGYKTMTASDGNKALALVDQGASFDLLFTDVIMPGGMNGRKLADAVTARRPFTKLLFTSGYTENAIVHHGRLDAGVFLLAKPYRKSELARMVRVALNADVAARAADAPNSSRLRRG